MDLGIWWDSFESTRDITISYLQRATSGASGCRPASRTPMMKVSTGILKTLVDIAVTSTFMVAAPHI